MPVERHPLPPFLPPDATRLFLGSFPPPRQRWSMDFFYPNLQNDFWRIFGLVYFQNKDYFLRADVKKFDAEKIQTFLRQEKMAFYDTATEVIRQKDNASDAFLQVVRSLDLEEILLRRIPSCRTLLTTGEKATDTLLTLIQAAKPTVGGTSEFLFHGRPMRLYRLPSSSRAYPLPLAKKAEIYAEILNKHE